MAPSPGVAGSNTARVTSGEPEVAEEENIIVLDDDDGTVRAKWVMAPRPCRRRTTLSAASPTGSSVSKPTVGS